MNPRAFRAFALAALVLAPGLVPAESQAQVPIPDSVRIREAFDFRITPPVPCPGDTLRLVVRSNCPGCVSIDSMRTTRASGAIVNVTAQTRAVCNLVDCLPSESWIFIPSRVPGNYVEHVVLRATLPVDSLTPAGGQIDVPVDVAFTVGDTCPVVPVQPAGLPFVQHVSLVGGVAPCDTCTPRVCAGQPLVVHVTGEMPTPCYTFLGGEVLPLMNPLDPPQVRLRFRRDCVAPCAQLAMPFEAFVPIGDAGILQRTFNLGVVINACPDTTQALLATKSYAYFGDTCGVPAPTCVFPYLEPMRIGRDTLGGCEALVPSGGQGWLVFGTRTGSAPVAGLQGRIYCSSQLHVLRLVPVGPAQGMHLLSHTTADGVVEFVMFSDAGAPIPAGGLFDVLRVDLAADSIAGPAESHGIVSGVVTAASDSLGNSLGMCPIMTLVAVYANVCILLPPSCDANGDGQTNVADLVRLARCWFQPALCPDSTRGRDCDGDGVFGVSDILCCARTMLGIGPPDSAHVVPGFSVALGTPVREGDQVRVPLTIRGAGAMSGALLHLSFPGDRYTLVPPAAPTPGTAAASSWLPLVQPGEGDAVVGVLRLDDAAAGDVTVPLVLALRPGQVSGGSITVDRADAVAPDGRALSPELASSSMPLDVAPGAISRVDLACGPNPSRGTTRFVVRLPAAATVDLAVFDLAGRRVASLWRGALDAGETGFDWKPADGRSGVYFARLAVNGVVRTTRVTMQLAR